MSCHYSDLKFFQKKNNRKECSLNNGRYTRVRADLPLNLYKDFAQMVGRKTQSSADEYLSWKGLNVRMFDGTILSMPGTKGSVLNAMIDLWKGKGTGETSLYRKMIKKLTRKDLILLD